MLDHLLALLLLVAVPARALFSSLRPPDPPRPRPARYRLTIGMVAALLILLAIDWTMAGRSVASLGLALPASPAALAGIGAAALFLAAFAIGIARQAPPAPQDVPRDDLLPRSQSERRLFVGVALAVGFGWEALYRGFLLFYLLPLIGTVPALLLSATAYGAAHGFKGAGQFAASIAMALIFAGAYLLTGNLWWLIVIHTALPLVAMQAAARAATGKTR